MRYNGGFFLLIATFKLTSAYVIVEDGENGFRETKSFDCEDAHLYSDQILVHISVSALLRPKPRLIELNWQFSSKFTPRKNDSVSLLLGNPTTRRSEVVESVVLGSIPGGRTHFVTGHQYRRPVLGAGMKEQCTRYWIGYYRGGRLLVSNCMRIRPDWMWRNRDYLADYSLWDIMIPGTHDSGAYNITATDQPTGKLVINQDEDVWSQLMHGVRCLDLRIGHREEDRRNKFWIYHGLAAVRPFSAVLNDIKKFINSTKEVVIVDFHRFPVGFEDDSVHDEFASLLEEHLHPWMAPQLYDVTLGELWASDRRLVVGYAHQSTVNRSHLLWINVDHAWADTREKDQLFTYLDAGMQQPNRSDQLWSAMAELTPRFWYLLFPYPGLRQMADRVNRDVTRWCRNRWWHRANIVSTDFFLGNDVISAAVDASLKRNQCYT